MMQGKTLLEALIVRRDSLLDQTLPRRAAGGRALARDPRRDRAGPGRDLRLHRQHRPARRSIHNFGDAATAIPLEIAFFMRSERAERIAGYFVVFAIFVSAAVAAYEAVLRLIEPQDVEHSVPSPLPG